MVYDEEKQHGELNVLPATDEKLAATTVDINSRGRSPSDQQEYQGMIVKQDNGILSRLRNMEAAMDRKLGVESEAIDRKLPDQRQPMTWHSHVTLCL